MRLKLTIMAAIGGITALAGIAAPAEAQPGRHGHGYYDRGHGHHGYRRGYYARGYRHGSYRNRGWRHHRAHYRGPRHGYYGRHR